MFKRKRYGRIITASLLAVLLGMTVFSGCAETIGPRDGFVTSVSEARQTTVTTEKPVPAAETQSAAVAEPEPEPEPEPELTSPEPTRNELVRSAAEFVEELALEPADKAGVYEVKGLSAETPEIEYLNGVLLEFVPVGDANSGKNKEKGESDKSGADDLAADYDIRVCDPKNSLLLGKSSSLVTGYYPYSPKTCGAYEGGFYSCTGRTARLMDIGMNVTDEFELPVTKCSRLWLTDGGRYILCNSERGPSRLYDVCARAEIGLTMQVKAVCVLSTEGDSFDVINIKGERFRISPDGSVTPLGQLSIPKYYTDSMDMLDGMVIDAAPAGLCVRRPALGTTRLIEYPPRRIQYVLSAADRYILFTDHEDHTRVIDMQTGGISGSLGRGVWSVRGFGEDGGFIFFGDDGDGNYRCRLAVPSEVRYIKTADIGDYTDAEEYRLYFAAAQPDSERTKLLIDELRERYNVRVSFSPLTEKERYCGYYCKAYNGEKAVILEALRNFLALSPPQLLSEAAEGGAETWILICSNIVDEPDQSSYGTAAFASSLGLHPFVALETPLDEEGAKNADHMTERELYDYFAKYICDNFSHEFIHILDGKTNALQTERWDKLSPEGCYFGTYDSVNADSDEYVSFGSEFDDGVYFVDFYSRVNELEDKARTGENLYYAREGGSETAREKFARSRSLYDKAAELCRILRENYPCLAEIPAGEWYLEKPLMGSYEELKKSWKADSRK